MDAEFATGEILKKAKNKQVILNTPGRQVNSHEAFPKSEFTFDAESETYTGPLMAR